MTPEGRIKAMVKTKLDGFVHWRLMPVQTGYGTTALDFIICINGWFVSIETKKDAKAKLTPRQLATKRDMEAAGGIVLVVYDEESCNRAFKIIEGICINGHRDKAAILPTQNQGPGEQHLGTEQQGETVAASTGGDHGAHRKEPRRSTEPSTSVPDQRATAAVTEPSDLTGYPPDYYPGD